MQIEKVKKKVSFFYTNKNQIKCKLAIAKFKHHYFLNQF